MDNTTSIQPNDQFSLIKIISIWLIVSAPMGFLVYFIDPIISPGFESDPLGSVFIRVSLITLGLIWQFVLSIFIIGKSSWTTIRERLKLNPPLDPKTGESSRKLWFWAIPFVILLFAIIYPMIGPFLDRLWISLFPILAPTVGSNINEVLGSVEIQTKLVGNWSLVGLFLIMSVFNLIGEEFLFRGVLLPKMEGVFGKYDWVFNGVMMGAYHWHQPWTIPGAVVASIFCFSFPAKRFRSTCLSMVIHSIQFLFVIPGIIIIVLGLGP